MKDDLEDVGMASVWYVVAGLVVIGIIGVVVVVLRVNSLQHSMVPLH
jgi:hypothetical protein